jgi:very-short-patch-repair endonuclease
MHAVPWDGPPVSPPASPSHQPPKGPQRFFDEPNGKSVAASKGATAIIRKLAERQHGVVARWQLVEAGLGSGLIQQRVRAERLLQLHQGVFAVGHRRLTRYGEWMAAVLACGPNAVLSHASAAGLWAVRGSRGPIEVLRTSGNRKPHGVRLHQTRHLPTADITRVANIPVTTIERTAVDMAPRLDRRQMERFLVDADRAGYLSWATLSRVLERPGGRKGMGRLRRVAARVDPQMRETRSDAEIDFFALCRDHGLPLPQVNVLVEGYLVDFHWPRERLIVETDTYSFHGDRRAFERDRKATVVLSSAGYLVHRFTWEMIESEPLSVTQLVRRSLEERKGISQTRP